MTIQEKQDLKNEALRYLTQLLPPEKYGEDERCAAIQTILDELASDGVSASVSDLLIAKRHLYSLLLQKDGGESESNLTEIEIEIMYQLSLDHQIQEYLSDNR